VAPSIKTGRGTYHLKLAAPPERSGQACVLTLALERADGIEKVALRCRVAGALGAGADDAAAIEAALERLAPWIEREFERTREEALKSIRSDRRLLEIEFRDPQRGPF
jgi:hypothetical protein